MSLDNRRGKKQKKKRKMPGTASSPTITSADNKRRQRRVRCALPTDTMGAAICSCVFHLCTTPCRPTSPQSCLLPSLPSPPPPAPPSTFASGIQENDASASSTKARLGSSLKSKETRKGGKKKRKRREREKTQTHFSLKQVNEMSLAMGNGEKALLSRICRLAFTNLWQGKGKGPLLSYDMRTRPFKANGGWSIATTYVVGREIAELVSMELFKHAKAWYNSRQDRFDALIAFQTVVQSAFRNYNKLTKTRGFIPYTEYKSRCVAGVSRPRAPSPPPPSPFIMSLPPSYSCALCLCVYR